MGSNNASLWALGWSNTSLIYLLKEINLTRPDSPCSQSLTAKKSNLLKQLTSTLVFFIWLILIINILTWQHMCNGCYIFGGLALSWAALNVSHFFCFSKTLAWACFTFLFFFNLGCQLHWCICCPWIIAYWTYAGSDFGLFYSHPKHGHAISPKLIKFMVEAQVLGKFLAMALKPHQLPSSNSGLTHLGPSSLITVAHWQTGHLTLLAIEPCYKIDM